MNESDLPLAPLPQAEGLIKVSSRWSMVSGQWSVVSGQWSVVSNPSCQITALFPFVPEPVWDTIRGGGAAHPRFRAMPAIAATLVVRQKRMRICLQARSNTLTLRSNLRFP